MKNLKFWIAAFVFVALIFVCATVFCGCVTTGSVPSEIIAQSAAVDTSISQLQTQQATSAETVTQVSATTDVIEQTAKTLNDGKLTGQVATLKTQVKTLTDSLKIERDKTTKIQSDYSTVKVSSGTEITNQSGKIIKQAAQIKARSKCIIILAVILFIHLLLDAAVLLLKFYFHKI
jgi:hypothetical protein